MKYIRSKIEPYYFEIEDDKPIEPSETWEV